MAKSCSNLSGISLVVHTKNEEKNIEDCILSAKEIVDEVIVIDMSSSDRTVEIAKRLGAIIYTLPADGFVTKFRNFGIGKVKTKWVLSLDADERLTKKLAKRILEIVKDDKYDIVRLPRKNIRLNKWMKHTGYWPDYQTRLFRKGFLKWPLNTDQPHVVPEIKGRVLDFEPKEACAIVHYNLENIKRLLLKYLRYYDLKDGDDFFEKNNINPEGLINYYTGEFKYRYTEEKGYLDGMRGFIFAKFREYYKFLDFVKWWENNGYKEIFSQDELLKIVSGKNEDVALNQFRSSRFFKLWQFYYKQKTRFLNLLRKR